MSSRTIVGLWPTVVLSDPARWVGLNPLTAKRPPTNTYEMDKEETSKFWYWSGKTLGPLGDKKLSRAPCIVFKYTLIPISFVFCDLDCLDSWYFDIGDLELTALVLE